MKTQRISGIIGGLAVLGVAGWMLNRPDSPSLNPAHPPAAPPFPPKFEKPPDWQARVAAAQAKPRDRSDRPIGFGCTVTVKPITPQEFPGRGPCDRLAEITFRLKKGDGFRVLQAPHGSWTPVEIHRGQAHWRTVTFTHPVEVGLPSGAYWVEKL